MSGPSSAVNWTSAPVLPLGMRLTELKSRPTDFFVEPEVDFLDVSDAFSHFSSEGVPGSRHDTRIDKSAIKRDFLTEDSSKSFNPRVARIREFVKKYNINVSKNVKPKTPMQYCKPTLQNPRSSNAYRNKPLHYYNLLRASKEEDAEHPDIVRFRRSYNRHRPLSPYEASFAFRPNLRLSPSLEDQINFIGPRTHSPLNPDYKSCYFTPPTSPEDFVDFDAQRWPENCEQSLARSEPDCPTIADLVEYNADLPDDSIYQQQISPKHSQLLPYSPEMSFSVADTDTNGTSACFSNSQLGYSQNMANLPEDDFIGTSEASATSAIDGSSEVEFEKNTRTAEHSQVKDENGDSVEMSRSLNQNSITAPFSTAPDLDMEEISFSPDEDFDADVPPNAVPKVRFVKASTVKIFSDSSCSSSSASDC